MMQPKSFRDATGRTGLCTALFLALTMATGATAQDDEIDSIYRLTEAESTRFVEQIGECWFVDPSFRNVTVEVRFSLTLDGEVVNNFVDLVSARGGDATGQAAAYEAARTAIIRCEGRGYELPEGKYRIWEEMTLTFDGRNGRPPE